MWFLLIWSGLVWSCLVRCRCKAPATTLLLHTDAPTSLHSWPHSLAHPKPALPTSSTTHTCSCPHPHPSACRYQGPGRDGSHSLHTGTHHHRYTHLPTSPSPPPARRYQGLGRDGSHSLYRWFTSYEQRHFPDPMGLRARLQAATLGLYPGAIKWAMAVFDLPEAIAVARMQVGLSVQLPGAVCSCLVPCGVGWWLVCVAARGHRGGAHAGMQHRL